MKAIGRSVSALLLLLGWIGPPPGCNAQDSNAQPVHWSLNVARQPSPAKEPFRFAADLKAVMDDGWHVYSVTQEPGGPTKTTIDVPEGQPFYLYNEVAYPAPKVDFDANFGMATETHSGSVTYRLPIEIKPGTHAGSELFTATVRYMTCNERMCLPAQTLSLHTAVNVPNPLTIARPVRDTAAVQTTTLQTAKTQPSPLEKADTESSHLAKTAKRTLSNPSFSSPVSPLESDQPTTAASSRFASASAPSASVKNSATQSDPLPQEASDQSLGRFLLLALCMGLLSTLTPCVFPLMPVMVSYFSQRAKNSGLQRLRDVGTFSIGIVGTFTGVGLLVTLLAGAAGISRLAANPWVNLIMGLAFGAFAISLLGKLDLRLPHRWTQSVDRVAGRQAERGVGILLMGMAFALTSFTCTAPFVGSLLVMAARGEWRLPALGMTIYSLAFALPFLLFASVPVLLLRLPRAGSWMQSLKVVMGFIELAAVLKFLANADMVWHVQVLTRAVCLAAWASLAVLTALYLLGLLRFEKEQGRTVGVFAILGAASFLAAAILFAAGVLGKALPSVDPFLPPADSQQAFNSAPAESIWINNDYAAALAAARHQGKLVFIDFTGYTCTNCRWMEENIFKRPAVREELRKFVLVHLYTDGDGPRFRQQQEQEQQMVHTIALPYYVVVDQSGKLTASFPGLTHSESDFLAFLQKSRSPGPVAKLR